MRVDARDLAAARPRSSTWVSRLAGRISQYVNGDDIFLSYSRADGVPYAQALAAELSRRGFTCRLDLYDTDTSAEIPNRLKKVIRRAYLLLVIGSPRAWQSEPVKQEIELFATTGRNFVVIAFGTGIAGARWIDGVAGRVVQEGPDALHTGRPSRSMVSLAEDSFHFQKRNQRLRRTARITAISIAVMLLIGIAGGLWLRRDVAAKQQELATTQAALTKTQVTLGSAQQDLAGARVSLSTAQGELARTEEQRARAAADAARQEAIARARKEATDAVGIRTQMGYLPVPAALAAVSAARSLATLGLRGEADAVLRSVRSTLSARVDPPEATGLSPEPVESVIESPEGGLMAGQTTTGAETVVWKKGARDVLYRWPCGERAGFVHIAFDRQGQNLARDCAGQFTVFDLKTGRRREGFGAGWTSQIVFGPRHLYVVAQGEDTESIIAFDSSSGARVPFALKDRTPLRFMFSPDGRFLATSCRWYDGEPPANCAVRLLELPGLTPVLSQREPDESRLAFSHDGAYLAVRVGDVMRIWQTATQLLLATYSFPGNAQFQFGGNAGRLYVTTADDARILDTFSGEVLAVFPGGRRLSDDVRVAGAVAVAGPKFAETWKVQPLDNTGFLEIQGQPHRLQFDGTGRYFAVCTAAGQEPDWRISLWDAESAARLMETAAQDCAVAFHPGGLAFAFQAYDGSLQVLSLPRLERSSVRWEGFAFGEKPAMVQDRNSRTVRLLDSTTGKMVFESPFRAFYVATSQDGTLVLGADRRELRIWQVAGGKLLLSRPVLSNANRYAFSPDNRSLLVAAGARGRTRLGLYSWRLDDILEETCGALRSGLESRFEGLRPDHAQLARACPK